MRKIFVAEIKKASYICDDGYVILANNLDQAKDIAVAKFKKNHSWLNERKEFSEMLNSMSLYEIDMDSEPKVFFTSNVGG